MWIYGHRLVHKQDVLPHVGEFTIAPFDRGEVDTILGVLEEIYGSRIAVEALVPGPNLDFVRAALADAAPSMMALARELAAALEDDYSALIIEEMHLKDFSPATRAFILFALSVACGRPTATDRVNRRIVWDVRPRDFAPGHIGTFSENPYEAELHTDTQYFPNPEKYTLLYFLRPADCGGGISLLRDGRCVIDQLRSTEEGRAAFDYLSTHRLPFRIPTSYTRLGRIGALEATFAPIFGTRPRVRYRRDTLQNGLEAFPEHDTAELRQALCMLEAVLADEGRLHRRYLPADSLLLTNNHQGLHGRTEFQDRERHVYRIRISDGPDSVSEEAIVTADEAAPGPAA